MKILFSGHHNPHFFTITEYLEKAIRALGHELVAFEDRRHVIPGRIRRRLNILQRLDLNLINKAMRRLAAATKPDIAVITGGHRILPGTVEYLKRLGAISILWTIDPPRCFQPLLNVAPAYDHIFCQGTEAVEMFRDHGITGAHWLPMACDPEHHHPVECLSDERVKYGSDVAFVGSYYPERAVLFEPLVGLGTCVFSIWGPGWDALPASSPLRKHIRGLHTRPEEWLKIYSAGKIVLATHYHDSRNRFPVHQASPRVFEILACGAFQLCDDQRDVFTLFEDGRDLVKFTDAQDLVEKVQYYLRHPKERARIAARGKETVLARHTYEDRIKALTRKIGYTGPGSDFC